ncbi:hypothetical protein GGR51DRAFT_569207 [Nemania sp. FL0031]|nr:hypothetical protein GGR51DRAFT_569207 [Nemania sp. FL0031]
MEVNNQASASSTPVALPDVGDSSSPTGKKRKAPHEYSTNANTIRVRERNAKLNPYRRAVERAKSNDLKAVSVAWKQRTDSESFQAASESEKKRILENVEKEIMDRRRRKKIDYASKVAALNETLGATEDQPAPRSGLVNNNTAKSVPAMAPPGYMPFPTQPIPQFMEMPKTAPSLAPLYTNPVSSTTRAENNAVQSTSGLRAMGTTTVQNSVQPAPASFSISSEQIHKLEWTLKTLKEAYEADKRIREEENKRLLTELRGLQGVMESTRDQMQLAIDILRSTQRVRTHPFDGAPVLTRPPPFTQAPIHQPYSHVKHHSTTEGLEDGGDSADEAGAW